MARRPSPSNSSCAPRYDSRPDRLVVGEVRGPEVRRSSRPSTPATTVRGPRATPTARSTRLHRLETLVIQAAPAVAADRGPPSISVARSTPSCTRARHHDGTRRVLEVGEVVVDRASPRPPARSPTPPTSSASSPGCGRERSRTAGNRRSRSPCSAWRSGCGPASPCRSAGRRQRRQTSRRRPGGDGAWCASADQPVRPTSSRSRRVVRTGRCRDGAGASLTAAVTAADAGVETDACRSSTVPSTPCSAGRASAMRSGPCDRFDPSTPVGLGRRCWPHLCRPRRTQREADRGRRRRARSRADERPNGARPAPRRPRRPVLSIVPFAVAVFLAITEPSVRAALDTGRDGDARASGSR